MQTLEKTPDFLLGGGEMGERIRNFDWNKTPLGDPLHWDQSLKTSVSICLNSNFPIALYWGMELVLIYNDAWSPIPGNKNEWALGKPAREVWADIWNEIEPEFRKAFDGTPGGSKDALLPMQRHGYTEECYFDFTFTPVRGSKGHVEGIFNAVIENTYRIISERRSKVLNDLSLLLTSVQTQNEIFQKLNDFFKRNIKTISFAFFYSLKDELFQLIASTHDEEAKLKKLFPLEKSKDGNKITLIRDLPQYFDNIPKGFWEEEPSEAVILPIVDLNTNVSHYIVCGLNARRRYDTDYDSFFQSLSNLITKSLNTIASLQEERSRAEAFAEIDRAKTLFFTNISHEFRTPLTLMLGPIEEALKDTNIDPINLTRLDVAYRNAVRLLKLVNTLLDFSRIESGRQKASFIETDLGSFTNNLAGNFRSVIEKAGLQLLVKAADLIPLVYVDREMWEKIVFNLLSNAFKYTLEGTITVELSKEGNHAILKIKDTGIGIPENELPHMFERFHRVEHTTGRTFEGTGIGLSLTKELVQMHGGTISIQSKPGNGTTFIICMPLGKEHLPASQIKNEFENFEDVISDLYVEEATMLLDAVSATNKPETTIYENGNTSSPLVMIVDDNADMRRHLQTLLITKFKTVTATDGMDALYKLRGVKPALIISDIMMPVMDGIRLLKEIKSNRNTNGIPVILLTARAGEESKIEGWETGADDYLVKPFSARELIARVDAQIKIAGKRKAAEEHLRNLFMQAPVAIQILSTPDFVYEMMNEKALFIMNNAGGAHRNWKLEDVIGCPVETLMPQAKQQGLIGLLTRVYETGEPFVADEFPLKYNVEGTITEQYAKFAYVPLRDENGNITHIMVTGDDITPLVVARKKIEESERQLASLFKEAPVAIVKYKGEAFVVELANDQALEMWGKTWDEVKGKAMRDIFPEINNDETIKAQFKDSVEKFTKGETKLVNEVEMTFQRKGELHTGWFSYIHEPLRDLEGNITGIIATAIEVTDQVLARKKIEETNRQLEFAATVSESIADAVIGTTSVEDQYRIVSWNKGAELIYGWTASEVTGQPVNEVLASVSKYDEEKNWQGLVDKHDYWKGEVVQKRKDGKEITVLASVAYVRNKEGKILGAVAVNRDVTEQKLAREKIKESELRFRFLFDSNVLGVAFWEMSGTVYDANDAFLDLLGCTKEDMKEGKVNWRKFTLPEDESLHQEKVTQAVEGKAVAPYETRYIHKNGHILTALVGYAMLSGSKEKGIAFIQDIGKLKDVEAALRETEERFRTLAETLPQMVWVRNTEGIIEYGSKNWEVYSGIQSISKAWEAMVHPDDWAPVMSAWEKAVDAVTSFRYEVRLKNKNGEYRWHYATGEPARDQTGKVVRWIGALTDIHVQKTFSEKLEHEVAERTKDLIKANKELESFNYIASHDLQEPLRKIQTFITLIQKNKADSNLFNKYFEKINSSALRMSELIQSILSYSRISNNGDATAPTDLNQTLCNVETDFELLIKEKNAVIKSSRLPVIKANTFQMHQLFANLISNSLKFSGHNPEITIRSEIVNGNEIEANGKANPQLQFIQLTFSDNGIGFDPVFKEQIFQLFQRLHSKVEYSGTGIGLSIVKKIIDNHGGYITADSTLGKGATFTVWLPLA